MKFGTWFQQATDEVPNLARDVAAIYTDVANREIDVPRGAAYAWNIRGIQRLPWMSDVFTHVLDVAEDLLTSGAILPTPTDKVLLELSSHFRSSASWVFVVHGNVRDYVFDARYGYAPVPDVLASFWRNTTLFETGPVRGDAITMQYSLSGGIELAAGQESGTVAALRGDVEKHRADTVRASNEERVFRDLSFLRTLLERPDIPAILLYFDRAGLLFAPSAEQVRTGNWVEYILRWASQIPPRPRHMIVLAADTPDELHPELRKRVNGIIDVEVPRPGSSVDRRRFLLACIAATQQHPIPMPFTRLRQRNVVLPIDVPDIGKYAEATAGLNYAGIETCLLNILQMGITTNEEALDYIKRERGELLRAESEGLIELIEPTRGLNELVGGLTHIRSRLEMIVRTLSSEDPTARSLAPMGVLFIGPPGTGKSLTASALAHDCAQAGVQYVKLGDFRDMWVGQSERNFSRILKLLESFGKVIVFIDELDQGEGASRGDEMRHETSRRIFGKLLEFMASPRNRGRILWIAASNRPSLIDAAMLRPGRFDLILPFAPPDAAGCREILERHLSAHSLEVRLSDAMYAESTTTMAAGGFTGAEIELVATETARRTFQRKGDVIADEDLRDVLADYDPATKKTEAYQKMLAECQAFVAFRSLRDAH